MTTQEPRRKLCFVIMPFSKTVTCEEAEWTHIFEDIIKPAVESSQLGYECRRSVAERGNIIREIIESLNEADVVIADLTDQNPNVFYELGVRHALSKRTILIRQSGTDLPFDLEPYACPPYRWKTTSEKEDFQRKLQELLEEVEKNPEKSDSPVSDFLQQKGLSIRSVATKDTQLPSWDKVNEVWVHRFSDKFQSNDVTEFRFQRFVQPTNGMVVRRDNCAHQAVDGVLTLGQPREHAMAEILGIHLAELAVEIDLRILDHSGRSDLWAGIQLRGYQQGATGGYLVYLRGTGQVELYTPQLVARHLFTLPYALGDWLRLRIVSRNRSISVSAPEYDSSREFNDLDFIGPGWVALQAFWVTSEFRNIRIWSG